MLGRGFGVVHATIWRWISLGDWNQDHWRHSRL